MDTMTPFLDPSLDPGFGRSKFSAGIRLARKEDMKNASKPLPPDPDQKGHVAIRVVRTKFDKPGETRRRDAVVKFNGTRLGPGGGGGVRGDIKFFSNASQRRLTMAVRNTADLWDGFLTLTYPADFPTDGRAVKRHLNAFCSYLRRNKVAYIWVLEFQKRGAPHFHFLLRGFLPKKQVATHWADIVGSWDRERHIRVGTRIEGVKNPDQVGAYMSAYMNKLDQKIVPRRYAAVGRFWGSSRLLTSTLYRLDGLRREASRAIRTARKWYAAKNQNLAGERADKKSGLIRRAGFRWRWRGRGFVLIEGAGLVGRLLKQAAMMDQGLDIWKEWDGEPLKRAQFLTVADKMESTGQVLIDGGLEHMGHLIHGKEWDR